MVTYDGQSYTLRVVTNEPVPIVPGLTQTATRIVAPDAATALAIYRANCRKDGETATLDRKTGEYVIPGPCL